jgi:nucleoside-diphosphate-sugar epimerase
MRNVLSHGNLPFSDLEDIVRNCEISFKELNSKEIVILGGTGFIGKWLVSGLLHANEVLNLRNIIHVYTRNPKSAKKLFGNVSEEQMKLHRLDLMDTKSIGIVTNADIYLHGATPSVADTGSNSELAVKQTTFQATQLISRAVQESRNKDQHVLHLSSGAVYFENSASQNPKPEVEILEEKKFLSKYAEVKLATEFQLKRNLANRNIPISNPRLFAFAGPHLALDRHFAVGNFMRDALEGRDVEILGSPNTIRSYMYPSDLISILIKVMQEPHEQPINIGSPYHLNLSELGKLISNKFGTGKVIENDRVRESDAYYPKIINQEKFLTSDQLVSLEIGLERWYNWLKLKERI